MLNFVKGFLYIYWDNHMAFIFQFINVHYTDWFADIEESLHPCNKAHLVMMYDLLYFCIVCCDLSIFISNFIDLIFLPLFLDEFG